jgi:hypothetical protein
MILLEQEFLEQKAVSAIAQPAEQALLPALVGAVTTFTTAEEPVTETFAWKSASGAGAVEVTGGSLTVGAPAQAHRTIGSLSISRSGKHSIINFGQSVRLVALTLDGFTYRPQDATEDQDFSPSSSARLVIAVPNPQTEWMPMYAIPDVSRASTPKLYAGATMSGKTVHFPADVQTVSKVRISVIDNFAEEDEDVLSSTIAGATAQVKNLPEDLTVTNAADGATIFAQDGLYLDNAPNVTLDMVSHAQGTLDKQLRAGEPLSFGWHVETKTGTAFHYAFQPVQGALLRTFTGVTRTELGGESQAIPLDLAAGQLDGETPAAVSADLTVTYAGLRVLPLVNDAVPTAAGDVRGQIVGEEPVARTVLDGEIATYPIARIGLIGRAPEACELSVWLATQVVNGQAGAPLTDPGVVQLGPGSAMRVIWVELPQAITHAGPLSVQVRANSGRLLWVAGSQPALKIAVLDPEPNGRPVSLQDRLLLNMATSRIHLPRTNLAPELFAGTPPRLASELFVTVEFTDLTLRYKR